ncbi:hypothetical protein [Curtobacterium sp. MCBA15_001]|uniref:hypothetical protein n=1 Tax=Curtobacterium sp. MCBA15_001 TaxID=1898731 RepID=UPI0008DD8464|nr:hypothetical protein [Curtobacterium sp. MCBA15_001]OIH93696.1 hypothetical protein BIU90_08605 [Curtobacterium sp. MCBA15_001]
MLRVPAVLVAVLGVALLGGCSSPSSDAGALSAWQRQQDLATEADPAVLGVLVADVDAGEQAPQEIRPGVRLQFPASQPVDHLEFSCYGNGAMRAVIRTVAGDATRDTTVGTMACRDSPHRIDVPRGTSAGIDSVACSGFDSDRPSTWRLVVIGRAQPAS